mgnify:CR=1 FL=1
MKNYLIEIAGKKYAGYDTHWKEYEEQEHVLDIATGHDFSGEGFYLISDFGQSIDIRMVKGDRKYSEILLAKQLRDEGEVVGSVEIVVAQKNKINEQTSSVVFQSVGLKEYTRYSTISQTSTKHRLLIPYTKIFSRLIKRYGSKDCCGVMLLNKGNEVDILMYKGEEIIVAKSQKIFETDLDDEAFAALMREPIARLAQKNGIEIL